MEKKEKVFITGDSYSYAFRHYIKSPQVRVETRFAEYIMNIDNKTEHIRQTGVDKKKYIHNP